MKLVRIYCKEPAFVRGCMEMTQKDLSAITGLAVQTIINYEKGRKSHGSTKALIGASLYNALLNSSVGDDLKKLIFDEYFIVEELEL